MKRDRPSGFTLVELLVVIAIIGALLGMTLPAVMASRESGRRNICRANLAQLLLALQSYENSFGSFPSGVVNPDGPIRSEPIGLHQGWLIGVLPYLDEQNVYAHIDLSKSVYDPANAAVRGYWPRKFICPSEPRDIQGASNYAGCHHDVEAPIAADNRGVLFLNSHIRREDVTDGLAHTLFVGEKLADTDDLGWLSGTRATLRNTGSSPNDRPLLPEAAPQEGKVPADNETVATYVGGFSSAHPGGTHVGFGDGSVEFIIDGIDQKVWHQMGNRSDGELPAATDEG
jgi:prepilin-type N-terminal cleavage/methylation domain-containing protein/prepilin-type processing-associated H-X9-DG protein